MKPIDYRNETWEGLQERLTELRLRALSAWRIHGPGTTRDIALRGGMDLLTFRPRTTELFQLGLVVIDESSPQPSNKSEGVYRALSDDEAREVFAARCVRARQNPSCQPELKLLTPVAS